jgi:hypothetical protein
MAAKISYIIPESNCEKITKAIADQLRFEIANQYTLTANSIFNADVYEERYTPFSDEISKNTIISVHMRDCNVENSNPEFQRMICNFFVIISHRYVKDIAENGAAQTTESNATDISSETSQKECKKIAYAVRYIFQSKDCYLIHSSISSFKVKSIRMASPFREDSAENETSAEVLFEVEFTEPVNNMATASITGADVITDKIKYSETNS